MTMKLRVFTSFSGYDSQLMALRDIGANYECVGWSEIDRCAIKAHNAVFPELADRNYGDITKIDWNAVPDFDLFTYSFPCTDISSAGEQKGFEEIVAAKENDTVLEGTVQGVVKGGIIVAYAGVRVFIPASQSGLPRGAELDTLVKTKVRFVILEVNEHRRRAVGSIRAVQKAEKEAAKEKFWETAEVGATYKGEVKSLTSYGAFVDLGGIDGMVHISELSWKRIKHPSEVVKVGDVIEVYIKELDPENNRISLGYKKTEDNPWEKFKATYKVGDIVDATIVSITPFGAFAQIMDGVDGLIHISQLADKRVENVKDIVAIGDVVKVKIIDIDIDNKRISISMRALLEDEAEGEDAE